MRKISAITFAVALLIGCATSREVPGDYELVSTAKIPASALPGFMDCVNNTFRDRTIGLGVTLTNRQQQRSSMTRIELVSGEWGAVLSADIHQDGKVELYETTLPVRSRTEDEKAGYASCLQRFK